MLAHQSLQVHLLHLRNQVIVGSVNASPAAFVQRSTISAVFRQMSSRMIER